MMINLKIDGRDIKAKKGITVLEAAQSADIYIPSLCSDPNLPPFGACRLCIVEISGLRGYPTSCTTPAQDGMVVKTNTPKIIELRKNILKLMLSYHTSPCLVCLHKDLCEKYRPNRTKSGKTVRCESCNNRSSCETRRITKEYEIDDLGMPVVYKNRGLERNDPFMDRDYNLCILCGKCSRICKKIHGTSIIDFINRGEDTIISAAFHRDHVDTECCFCGACVDICPAGTLSDRFAKWYGEPDEIKETKCDLCPVGCAVKLKVKDGKVFGAEPKELTKEAHLCAIGRFVLPQVYESPDRINAAVEKLASLQRGKLIQNIIVDIKNKMGTSKKKADIVLKLKSVLAKADKESLKAKVTSKELQKKAKGEAAEKLFEIVKKREIIPSTYMFTIHAPDIAKKCKPGQFVIAIANERSERIPYTIVDWDRKKGTVTINVQEAGRSSQEMAMLNEGESLAHFVGPLGNPAEIKEYGTVVCGGGCFGVGAILPVARALKKAGNKVICIEEASSSYLLYLQDELSECCDELVITTKDGSSGIKGGVQEAISMLKERGEEIDQAFIVGCSFMMMLVSETTKKLNIPTLTALNTIMIDGTGMCGACRVTLGDETKFVCVDGPFLDGHLINWVELMQRRSAYTGLEIEALPQDHQKHKHICMEL